MTAFSGPSVPQCTSSASSRKSSKESNDRRPRYTQSTTSRNSRMSDAPMANSGWTNLRTMFTTRFTCRQQMSQLSPDMRALSSCVRPGILRGIRANVALSGCGDVFKSGGIGKFGDDYKLSEQVEYLDDFISHDWGTGRYVKFLTLCVVLNVQAAMLISLIFGVVLNVAYFDSIFSPLPRLSYRQTVAGQVCEIRLSIRCQLGCPIAFFVVLFFWQQIQSTFGCPVRRLFIDKVCINQIQEDLKAEGILSLAGFLKHSRRLVILWHPRYFTRLWCTYEIASWLHLGKDIDRSVKLVPVDFCGILLFQKFWIWSGLLWMAIQRSFLGLSLTADTFAHSAAIHMLRASFLFICGSVASIYCFVGIMRDLHGIRHQLAHFSIRNSDCFCCQHQHIHPETQERLPCDRKLVYQTLKGWSSSFTQHQYSSYSLRSFRVPSGEESRVVADNEPEVDDCDVDSFDNIVRTSVAAQLGSYSTYLDYSRALVPAMPYLWYLMDKIPNTSPYDVAKPLQLEVLMRLCGSEMIYCFAIVPSSFWILCHVGGKFDTSIEMPNHRCRPLVVALLTCLSTFLLVFPFVMLFEFCLYAEAWQPQALVSVLLLSVTTILYCRRRIFDSVLAVGSWASMMLATDVARARPPSPTARGIEMATSKF